jgi:hypothetical protein
MIDLPEIYQRYKDYTLVDEVNYIANLQLCQDKAPAEGCIVECGVWKGGMLAGMAEVLPDRKIYGYDSFEGLREPQEVDGPAAADWWRMNPVQNCAVTQEEAAQVLGRSKFSGLLIKGWFEETLFDHRPNQPIAVLRLDADWYTPTLISFTLYDLVTKGGLIIIDDYYVWDGCARAVHDFLSGKALNTTIQQFNNKVCYMVKK